MTSIDGMTSTDGTPNTERTIQLRRYVVLPGLLDEFLAWWRAELVPAREASGFAVEFGYVLRESNEFVWAVSLPGGKDRFAAVEADYLVSPGRTAAFAARSTWTSQQVVSLVEPAV
jgi:hypothetical protein